MTWHLSTSTMYPVPDGPWVLLLKRFPRRQLILFCHKQVSKRNFSVIFFRREMLSVVVPDVPTLSLEGRSEGRYWLSWDDHVSVTPVLSYGLGNKGHWCSWDKKLSLPLYKTLRRYSPVIYLRKHNASSRTDAIALWSHLILTHFDDPILTLSGWWPQREWEQN